MEIQHVSLRLLPQPGFDLENFVVHDDPGFSAEPMLRAQEVTAALRLTSLLRGRLEIARLDLAEPSLNLVRNHDGHWNIENLLERAAKTPVAPTGKSKRESRPGFPYIAADGGRINFKFEQEKKAYALTDADFSFWQETENTWGTRLTARPLRTDFNLTDTGLLRVTGLWRRAVSLRETPLQFSLQWDNGQLGQVTKLISGNDKGWRGAMTVSANLSGTPADLAVQTSATVRDFRRYDILGGRSMVLAAQCSARYSSIDRTLSQIACSAPVGGGSVRLAGSVAVMPTLLARDLVVRVQDVPLQSVVTLARHAKRDIPEDLVATGKLNGSLSIRRPDDAISTAWEGSGEIPAFRLASKLLDADVVVGRVPFSVGMGMPTTSARHRRSQPALPAEPRLSVGPFEVELGRPSPASVQAWASRSGYNLQVKGETQLQRLLEVARVLGIPASAPTADGAAKVDLQIAGAWAGFAGPKTTGIAQLHAVRAEIRGVNAPVAIASATVVLGADEVAVPNFTAAFGASTWRGSLSVPRPCPAGACPVRFDLQVDEASTAELSQLLNPRLGRRPWYRFLSPSPAPGPPFLAMLRASGKVAASRVRIDKLVATRVSATAVLDNGTLRLSDLKGDVLGGKHAGEWTAEFTAKPPKYAGSGTLEGVGLAQLADAMQDRWVTGVASAKYEAIAAGVSRSDLLASLSATVRVDVRDGSLPHITLTERPEHVRMRHFAAQLRLRDGKFEIAEGKLETTSGIYQVSGTASLGRALDVRLSRGGTHGFNITGTLTQPRVVQATFPETQAALKP